MMARRNSEGSLSVPKIAFLFVLGALIGLTTVFRASAMRRLHSNQAVPLLAEAEQREAEILRLQKEVDRLRALQHADGFLGKAELSGSSGHSQSQSQSCPEDPAQQKVRQAKAKAESDDPELAAVLREVQIKNEVMVALANGVMICQNTTICWWNGGNILREWLDMVKFHGITNYVVGVLDDETWNYMNRNYPDVKKFRPKARLSDKQKGSHPANVVSTLKYGLLKQILEMEYHVLVSDMDLVFVSNPFDHLYRDCDIEAQSDGFTYDWANGHIESIHDPTMGWGAGGLYVKVFTLNVGLMYTRATPRSIDLMDRVSNRLYSQQGWDQQVFNEEALFFAHGQEDKAGVAVRVMEHDKFANSKTFFRSERQNFLPGARASKTPVMVHMNYHPDKHRRMQCLVERYIHGKVDACDDFPGGEKPGT